MAAWGFPDALERWRLGPRALVVLGPFPLLALTALAKRQASYWQNGETLYRRWIAVARNNWMMHPSLGSVLNGRGRADEAIAHYREALRIDPGYGTEFENLKTAKASAASP